MQVTATDLPDVKLITPKRFGDERGFLSEVYKRDALRSAGITAEFVQDNHTFSANAETVRGLHYQIPPAAQAKLVFVVHGAIIDIVVDIRWGSPTYGHHVRVKLDDQLGQQLFIPEGFAHGFRTLFPNTQVYYKISALYSQECERGIPWNDPQLGIDWQLTADQAILSDRDRRHPPFGSLDRFFHYQAASSHD